jgi:hypothetical protein
MGHVGSASGVDRNVDSQRYWSTPRRATAARMAAFVAIRSFGSMPAKYSFVARLSRSYSAAIGGLSDRRR